MAVIKRIKGQTSINKQTQAQWVITVPQQGVMKWLILCRVGRETTNVSIRCRDNAMTIFSYDIRHTAIAYR